MPSLSESFGDRVQYRAKCRNCRWETVRINSGAAIEARASAHANIYGHEVDIRFSLYDVPWMTIHKKGKAPVAAGAQSDHRSNPTKEVLQ